MISAFSYLTCFAFRFLMHMFRLLSRSGDPWGNYAAAFCCAHHWLASLVDLSVQSLLWFWCNQYGPCFGIRGTNVPSVTFLQRSFRHPWGLSLTTRNLFAERDRQYFTACRWNEIQESGWCWEMLFAKILSWRSGCMVSRLSPGSTLWGLSNCGGLASANQLPWKLQLTLCKISPVASNMGKYVSLFKTLGSK